MFFFFNDTATTEIYTLSLHDALPISPRTLGVAGAGTMGAGIAQLGCLAGMETHLHDPVPEALERGAEAVRKNLAKGAERSEEHTSELQSRQYLVCRLLLEKKQLRLRM